MPTALSFQAEIDGIWAASENMFCSVLVSGRSAQNFAMAERSTIKESTCPA